MMEKILKLLRKKICGFHASLFAIAAAVHVFASNADIKFVFFLLFAATVLQGIQAILDVLRKKDNKDIRV